MPVEPAPGPKSAASAQLPTALIYSQDDFEEDISNLFYDAWRFRGSENHLYPLYNHILSLSCLNLRHPNLPRTTLVCGPQPLFGEPPAAKTEDEAKTNDDPKANGSSKKGGTAKAKQASKKEPKRKPRSLKQIPDFARVVVFGDDGELLEGTGLSDIRGLVEFCELKVLNCSYPWWTKAARKVAEAEMRLHLTQVYNAAMAGFANNPKWNQVHAILIVGACFTQMVWSSRPAEKALKPMSHARVPKTILGNRSYNNIVKTLLRQLPNFEARVAPECLFYNAPVFTYPNDLGLDQGAPNRPRISLSSQFLFALDRPIRKLYPKLTPRSSLFEAQVSKPRITYGAHSKFKNLFQQTLIQSPCIQAKEQARALGYRFPEDGPATPTPPNSVVDKTFKANVKNVKSLPKSEVVTRGKSLRNLPGIEHVDGSGDEASDSESGDEGAE